MNGQEVIIWAINQTVADEDYGLAQVILKYVENDVDDEINT